MATQHMCWPVYHFMCSSRVAQPVLCFDTEKMGNGEEKEEKFKEYVRKMEYRDSELWNCERGKTLQVLAVETSVVKKSRRETWVRSYDERCGVLHWRYFGEKVIERG